MFLWYCRLYQHRSFDRLSWFNIVLFTGPQSIFDNRPILNPYHHENWVYKGYGVADPHTSQSACRMDVDITIQLLATNVFQVQAATSFQLLWGWQGSRLSHLLHRHRRQPLLMEDPTRCCRYCPCRDFVMGEVTTRSNLSQGSLTLRWFPMIFSAPDAETCRVSIDQQ